MNETPFLTTRRIILYSTLPIVIFTMAFLNMDGIDFGIFYSASQLALKGQPEMIYNIGVHHQVVENVLHRSMPFLLAWFYPPTFLLLIIPISLLPFNYSLIIWIIITLVAYVFTIYKIAPHKLSIILALGFPGILANLLWGQNGFLTSLFLGCGLYYVETNPILSGLMISLLFYKPQFALLSFLVLLIGRHWRTLLWTLFFAGTMTAISILAFGFDLWQKYIELIPIIPKLILNDWVNISAINTSVYSFVRLLTGNQYLSTICQTAISSIVVILVCWTWIYVKNHNLRCVILSTGVLLTTPYILEYDLVLLALPLAFYGWDIYKQGWLKGELVVLFFLYLLPLLNWTIVETFGVQITPIALIILIIMALRRIRTFKAFGGQSV